MSSHPNDELSEDKIIFEVIGSTTDLYAFKAEVESTSQYFMHSYIKDEVSIEDYNGQPLPPAKALPTPVPTMVNVATGAPATPTPPLELPNYDNVAPSALGNVAGTYGFTQVYSDGICLSQSKAQDLCTDMINFANHSPSGSIAVMCIITSCGSQFSVGAIPSSSNRRLVSFHDFFHIQSMIQRNQCVNQLRYFCS